MENSYRFFKNETCKYFPCHKTENTKDFNCLFCFCPLYFLEDCEGDYKMISGIKDCSNCLIPHEANGYEYIIKKILDENKKKKCR